MILAWSIRYFLLFGFVSAVEWELLESGLSGCLLLISLLKLETALVLFVLVVELVHVWLFAFVLLVNFEDLGFVVNYFFFVLFIVILPVEVVIEAIGSGSLARAEGWIQRSRLVCQR